MNLINYSTNNRAQFEMEIFIVKIHTILLSIKICFDSKMGFFVYEIVHIVHISVNYRLLLLINSLFKYIKFS